MTMVPASLADLTEFFRVAQWPKETERRPTFFSIAGFPHYENVMSNVYQFFFSTENSHGLGSLCIDALLDVIRSKQALPWLEKDTFRKVYALRELGVKDQQRLDLLLHNGPSEDEWQRATAAILMENKVYHWLANDLRNYWLSVSPATMANQKIGIVLGLRPEQLPAPWIYVTHSEWASAVETRLGSLVYRAEPRYVTLLLELIENIRTMTNADENFGELLTFFQQNRVALSRAEQIRKEVFLRVPSIIRETISSQYEVTWNKEGSTAGWLNIRRPGNQHLWYILSYYEVFHGDDKTPNYRITLITDATDKSAQDWQTKLVKSSNSQEVDSSEPYHVMGKTYQLSPANYHRFPQLIAENLQLDWQPLEPYWLHAETKQQH